MANANFVVPNANKVTYANRVTRVRASQLIEIYIPCFLCSAIVSSSVWPLIACLICQRTENEPRKGPGISLIDENQRRRANISVTQTKNALATSFKYNAYVCSSTDMTPLGIPENPTV